MVEELLTIQQVAELTKLSEHTLRYYERIGLIHPIERADSGHRRYSIDDVGWIDFLTQLRSTGMSILQMQHYAELQRQGDSTLALRVELLRAHSCNVETRMADLFKDLQRIHYKIELYSEHLREPGEVTMTELIQQKAWSDKELTALEFAKYQRKKRLVMARNILETETPVLIEWPTETLHLGTDYMLCYNPGHQPQRTLTDYDYWPVRGDIFDLTYRLWDATSWLPTPAERHLLQAGCKPYFKAEEVWAKKLTRPTYIQMIESPKPVLVPPEMWLLIGILGEPWYMDELAFCARYTVIP
jgi:DNA-binding transcriptional MerR regulator